MKKSLLVTLFVVAIIEIINIFDHILGFEFPTYFYNENPQITKYIGTNVVSMWADFSYFTYLSVLLYCFWIILLVISRFLKINKLNVFLRNTKVISFIMVNYIFTTILYTIFELISGNITFGLYALNNAAIHNFGTNIITHYIVFVFAVLSFIKVKPLKSNYKYFDLIITIYLILYYFIVLLCGKFAYNIEWYPYIIFDSEYIGTILSINSRVIQIIVLILTNCIIYSIYMILFRTLSKYKTKAL